MELGSWTLSDLQREKKIIWNARNNSVSASHKILVFHLTIYFSSVNSTNPKWNMQYDDWLSTMTTLEATQAAETCCSSMERGTAGLQLVPSGLSMRAIPTAANSFLIKSDFSYSLFIRALVLSWIFCSTWSSLNFARFNAFSISCCKTCSVQGSR